MKLKELFYGLGLKPRTKEYPFEVETFSLPAEGALQFARWKHPKEGRKIFSQKAVDAIRALLREGDTAIDIGAHTGDTALPVALAVGKKGCVFALEPNPYAFKILEANCALNGEKTRTVPFMFAATEVDGEYEFEYSDSGCCNGGMHPGISRWRHAHFFKLKVLGKNLLNYLQERFSNELKRVRYVKIDTEGADRSVVASIKPLLIQNRPYLKSEIFRHLPEEERVGYHRDLRAMGYKIRKFQSEEDFAGEELTERQMMKWEHFDIFCQPAG
jgi:FkbM family methyltransferase